MPDTSQPPALPPPEQIILRDGTTANLRPGRADDVEKLEALFARASLESVWLRFFTAATRVSRREIDRMLDIDGVARMTYVVTRGEGAAEYILAIGNYVRLPRWDTAEVAFFVDDAYHGRGLGTVLLERLAAYAKQQRILTIVATVRPENRPMLEVFRRSGFEPHIAWDEGVMRVELPATPSEKAQARTSPAKPVLLCVLHQDRTASGHAGLPASLPVFRFPEAAARALAHAARYAAWLGRPPGEVAELDKVDAQAARRVIETALDGHGPTALDHTASRALLAAAGLSLSEAVEEADETTVIVRMAEDPSFGPLIGFGLSGAVAEVLHDRAFCITPLSRTDAQDLVRSIRGFPLLQGNHAAADLTGLEDLLLRVSWLIEECPEISALELQPVSVRTAGRGVAIRGGRVSVRPLRPGVGPASG